MRLCRRSELWERAPLSCYARGLCEEGDGVRDRGAKGSDMASGPSQDVQNKNRAAILAELNKEKKKLMSQTPASSFTLARPVAKEMREHAELQHTAQQQKAALQHAHAHSFGFFITQDSAFGNLILPVLPRLEPE
ncbi:unnamed protein product [Lampetra planeri]